MSTVWLISASLYSKVFDEDLSLETAPAYAGDLSSSQRPRSKLYSDPSITHNVDIRDYIVQEISYKDIDELRRLGAFLEHPTFNVHRRARGASRAKSLRPRVSLQRKCAEVNW